MDKKTRLELLRAALESWNGRHSGDFDRAEWAAKTAPLLKFNQAYYDQFMESAELLKFATFVTQARPHESILRSTVIQAITELEHGLESQPMPVSASVTPSTAESCSSVPYPSRVTVPWLFHNVPYKFWFWLAGLLVAAFVLGATVGSSPFYDKSVRPVITGLTSGKSGTK